jgi:signal transduction histidine kinase
MKFIGGFSLVWLFLILFYFILSNHEAYPQSTPIDSLYNIFIRQRDTTEKIKILNQMAGELLYSNLDSAIRCYQTAINFSEKTGNIDLKIHSTINLINAYKNKGLYNFAIELNFEMLISVTLPQHDYLRAKLLYSLGDLNVAIAKYEEGITHLNEALEIFIQNNDIVGKAKCYNSLASTFADLDKYYIAIAYADSAIILAEKTNDQHVLTVSYEIVGTIYSRMELYSRSLEYFLKAKEISEKNDDISGLTSILINMAQTYLRKGSYHEATDFAEKAYRLAEKSKIKPQIELAVNCLAKINARLGNFKAAYEYGEMVREIRTEGFHDDREFQISLLNSRYELAKKEQQIKNQKTELEKQQLELKKRNIQAVALISSMVFLLVIFSVVYYTQYRLKMINKLLKAKNIQINEQKKKIEAQAELYKNAYDKLKDLDDFKEAMTNMLVHDLKNPLNVLINLPGLGDFKEKDEIIHHTSRQMLNLVMNILDIQKFESNKLELNKVFVSVQSLVADAIDEIKLLSRQKGLHIVSQIDQNYIIHVDKELVNRILVNILTNAVRFSARDTEIKVNITEIPGPYIRFEIIDSGPGIAKEDQEMIFEKFVHIQQTGEYQLRSTGLGLTFCKMATEAHGGHIGVVSEINKGANFWITLPYASLKA